MALTPAEKVVIERRTARWVYKQGRGVTAKEVAKHFSLHIHTARLIIHSLMRRSDGIRCELAMETENTEKGRRPVKYFSVIYLPDEYLTRSRRKVNIVNERHG